MLSCIFEIDIFLILTTIIALTMTVQEENYNNAWIHFCALTAQMEPVVKEDYPDLDLKYPLAAYLEITPYDPDNSGVRARVNAELPPLIKNALLRVFKFTFRQYYSSESGYIFIEGIKID